MRKLLSSLSLALLLLTTTVLAGDTPDISRHGDDNLVESVLDFVGIGHE